MEEKSIQFTFKARYYQLGTLNEATQQLWFVLHGYGQLAQYFIKKFKVLTDNKICIIAPEGLSRFYQEGFTGRVGATWMTKENRLMDIENYIRYLDTVYNDVKKHIPKPPSTCILGFSQGSATATRWVMNKRVEFDKLILWAGLFPPDMDFDDGSQYLKPKNVTLVYGKQDPFLTAERLAEMNKLNQKLQIDPEVIEFDGGHDIDSDILRRMV